MNKARLIQLLQQFDDADDIKVYAGGIEQDIERIVLFKDPTKIHLVDADELATTPHPGETVLIMCLNCQKEPLKMVMKRSYKRQQVWNYVRENRKRFSVPHAMQQSLPLGKGGIKCFFQLLEANGLSECFEEVEVTHIARVKHYRLVKDPGFECPVFKNNVLQLGHLHAQDNLWRTMKILKTFDRYSLQVAASTEECRPGDDVTRKYLHFLMRAGYIVPIKKTPGKVWTYRFIEKENTGPNPPVVNVLNCVVDVNTNQIRYGEAV